MHLWSEEECRNFENGLRAYGTDYFQIRQNKMCFSSFSCFLFIVTIVCMFNLMVFLCKSPIKSPKYLKRQSRDGSLTNFQGRKHDCFCKTKTKKSETKTDTVRRDWFDRLERTEQWPAWSRAQHHQLRSPIEDAIVSAVFGALSALEALYDNALYKLTLTFEKKLIDKSFFKVFELAVKYCSHAIQTKISPSRTWKQANLSKLLPAKYVENCLNVSLSLQKKNKGSSNVFVAC